MGTLPEVDLLCQTLLQREGVISADPGRRLQGVAFAPDIQVSNLNPCAAEYQVPRMLSPAGRRLACQAEGYSMSTLDFWNVCFTNVLGGEHVPMLLSNSQACLADFGAQTALVFAPVRYHDLPLEPHRDHIAVCQWLQVFISKSDPNTETLDADGALIVYSYTLLARAGNEVQEVEVQANLSRQQMKEALSVALSGVIPSAMAS